MLNKFDLYEKETIRLSKRLNEIRREQYDQPYIDVPPFQRGWETSIILRDDISNRKDANFILNLIDIGYQKTKQIRKLEHVRLIRKGIYVHNWKSKYRDEIISENFIPDKIALSEKQYEKLTDREKRWFYKNRWSPWYDKRVVYYLNIPNYWIKLKVKPCMYDKIMDKNGELESEYHETLSKVTKPPYSKFYYKNSHYYNRDKVMSQIKLSKIKLKEGLRDYYEIISKIHDF